MDQFEDNTERFEIVDQDFQDHDILDRLQPSETDIESNQSVRSHKNVFNGSNIQVVVRKRPINSKEIENDEIDIVEVVDSQDRVTIYEPKTKVDLTKYTQQHDFIFDSVFDENSSNQQIYTKCVKPLLHTIFFEKGKATCFGYGQTGSGKTYTLLGSEDNKTKGLYIMAVCDIFDVLRKPQFQSIGVICSFYEIYGGKLFDLLADRKQILCREDGKQKVNIVGLTKIKCRDSQEFLDIIQRGNRARSSGMTGANDNSSRSHAILSIDLNDSSKLKKLKNKPKSRFSRIPPKKLSLLHGRISFIDLAGSERGADTANNNKQTRIEGAAINQSLLALKECIRALDQNHSHKPFRGSKLTQVLKESFMGNSKTVMIANISPNNGSCENTLNTLRYADRVKELKSQNSNAKRIKLTPPTSGDAYMPHRKGESKPLARNRSEPSLVPNSPKRPSTSISKQRKIHGRRGIASHRPSKSRAKSPNISGKSSSSNSSDSSSHRDRYHQNNDNNSNSSNKKISKFSQRNSNSGNNSRLRKPSTHLRLDNDSQQAPEYASTPRIKGRTKANSMQNESNRSDRPPRYPVASYSKDDTHDYRRSSETNISNNRNANRNQINKHFNVDDSNHDQKNQLQFPQKVQSVETKQHSRVQSAHSNNRSELSTKHLIRMHRKHIDEFMVLIKEDMSLLKDFDKGAFGKELYIEKLKLLLDKEAEAIRRFQSTFE